LFRHILLHLLAYRGFAIRHHHLDPAAETLLVEPKGGLALTVELEMWIQSHGASDKMLLLDAGRAY
jgi:hypothetical protein